MKNYVENKSIIITGAGSGFGRLVAQKAASFGASVTCVDINEDALKETAELLADYKDKITTVVADVASAADMKRAAAESLAAFRKIDVILNNAGIMPLAFYADHDAALQRWHDCIDINLRDEGGREFSIRVITCGSLWENQSHNYSAHGRFINGLSARYDKPRSWCGYFRS